eukprot:symbB.v1.2.002442.t1/scaffold126.1/size312799/6
MAERADLVLLTFDAHKLDISDEFQQVMEVLRPHANKVRCVLNKADQIDAANLVRVYGALLWNVGKVFQTPEVARVFVSSFWNEAYRFKDHVTLFEEDKAAVLKELESLPHTALLRKINNLTARVRRVRTHIIVIGYLRSRIPLHLRALGSDAAIRSWLCQGLDTLLLEAQRVHNLSVGDMPKVEVLRGQLIDFEGLLRLPSLDVQDVRRLDHVLEFEVPQLLSGVGGEPQDSRLARSCFGIGVLLRLWRQQTPQDGVSGRFGYFHHWRSSKKKRYGKKHSKLRSMSKPIEPSTLAEGHAAATALTVAAATASPFVQLAVKAGKFPLSSVYQFGGDEALHAAPAPAKPTRAALASEKPPKPQPREVPASVRPGGKVEELSKQDKLGISFAGEVAILAHGAGSNHDGEDVCNEDEEADVPSTITSRPAVSELGGLRSFKSELCKPWWQMQVQFTTVRFSGFTKKVVCKAAHGIRKAVGHVQVAFAGRFFPILRVRPMC